MHPKNNIDFRIMAVIWLIILGAAAGGVLLHLRNQSIETELQHKKQELAVLKQELETVQTAVIAGRETATPVDNPLSPMVSFDRSQQELFKGDLERIASDNLMKIIKSQLADPSSVVHNNPDYRMSRWYLVLTGDYRGLTGFLEALPRNSRPAMISDLKISTEYPMVNQYQLTARLTLDVIFKSGAK